MNAESYAARTRSHVNVFSFLRVLVLHKFRDLVEGGVQNIIEEALREFKFATDISRLGKIPEVTALTCS